MHKNTARRQGRCHAPVKKCKKLSWKSRGVGVLEFEVAMHRAMQHTSVICHVYIGCRA